MDDIIEVIVEILSDILEDVFDNIKSPRKRRWALTGLYSLLGFFFIGILLWMTISLAHEKNHIAVAIFGVITALVTVILGWVIIRGHRRNWHPKL